MTPLNHTDAYITVFTVPEGYSGGKTITKLVDGSLHKDPGILISGTVGQTRYIPTLEDFKNLYLEVSENSRCCIMLGRIKGTEDGKAFYVYAENDYRQLLGKPSKLKAPGIDLPGYYDDPKSGYRYAARIKRNVIGSTWCLFDRDIPVGMPEHLANLSENEWFAYMEKLVPGFIQAGKLIIPSSTGRVVIDGEKYSTRNFHVFVQIKDPNDLERTGSSILMNSVVHGVSFEKPKFSQSTGAVIAGQSCTIVDPTTFSRERICYEGKPIVIGEGLTVASAEVKRIEGPTLDTSLIPTPDNTVDGMTLNRKKDGGYSVTVDGGKIPGNLMVETEVGNMTISEYAKSDYEHLRCQSFNRPESRSQNGFLEKHSGNRIYFYDNGTRIGFYYTAIEVMFPDAPPTTPEQAVSTVDVQQQNPIIQQQIESIQNAINQQQDDWMKGRMYGEAWSKGYKVPKPVIANVEQAQQGQNAGLQWKDSQVGEALPWLPDLTAVEQLSGFQTTSWLDLSNKEFKPVAWVVEEILPPGVSLFVGKPKFGKSWAVLSILLLVTAGRFVFGRNTKKAPVLYLALEDSEFRLKQRTNILKKTFNLTDSAIQGFHVSLEAKRMDQGLEQQFIDHMERNPETCLIAVDVLAKVRRPREGSESTYDWDYSTTSFFKKITARYPHLAIVLVHHANKSGNDGIDAVSGTNGLSGGCDNVFTMINGLDGPCIQIHARDVADDSPIPLLKDQSGMWTMESRDSAKQKSRSNTRQKIIEAMQNGNETPKDIAEETGVKITTVNAQLLRMKKQNEVVKHGHGHYQLVHDGIAHLAGQTINPSPINPYAKAPTVPMPENSQ